MDNGNLTQNYVEEFPNSQRTLEILAVVILVFVVLIFAWLIYSTTCNTAVENHFLSAIDQNQNCNRVIYDANYRRLVSNLRGCGLAGPEVRSDPPTMNTAEMMANLNV